MTMDGSTNPAVESRQVPDSSMASLKARRSGSSFRMATMAEVSIIMIGAMLRDLVQSIGKTALAAQPLYLLKAILQCLRYGFGFCFAGQGSEIGSQFFSFVVSNVQCHVSL